VRLAFLGEVGRALALDTGWPGAADTEAWLSGLDDRSTTAAGRAAVAAHLGVTACAAAAVLETPVGESTLRAVSGLDPAWFGLGGRIARWTSQMRQLRPAFGPANDRMAARQAIAAAVSALAATAPMATDVATINQNLIDLLARCGEPGVLAAPVPDEEIDALAQSLAASLLADVARAAP
jgi:hypothetical protein